jgi:hypothetical protein
MSPSNTVVPGDFQRDLLLPPLMARCAKRRRGWCCA